MFNKPVGKSGIFNENHSESMNFKRKLQKFIVFQHTNKKNAQRSQNFNEKASKIKHFQLETTKNTRNAMVFNKKSIKDTVFN